MNESINDLPLLWEPAPAAAVNELTVTDAEPEKYVRIAITKNSRGYSFESTISLRWSGDDVAYTAILADLNQEADALARLEIVRRQVADRLDGPGE